MLTVLATKFQNARGHHKSRHASSLYESLIRLCRLLIQENYPRLQEKDREIISHDITATIVMKLRRENEKITNWNRYIAVAVKRNCNKLIAEQKLTTLVSLTDDEEIWGNLRVHLLPEGWQQDRLQNQDILIYLDSLLVDGANTIEEFLFMPTYRDVFGRVFRRAILHSLAGSDKLIDLLPYPQNARAKFIATLIQIRVESVLKDEELARLQNAVA